METVIRGSKQEFFEHNNMIKESQHGFRIEFLSLNNLLDLLYHVYDEYDESIY